MVYNPMEIKVGLCRNTTAVNADLAKDTAD
jgi:hypothetical protein